MQHQSFDAQIQSVLAEYQERYSLEFDGILPSLSAAQIVEERDKLLMSVGPEAGAFLNALIKATGAKVVFELGTSYGHSTVYLAEAARQNGGIVISCDLDANKQMFAKQMLERAGLAQYVEFVTGDAIEVARSALQPIEFCLIDLWNAFYIPAFDALYPRLAANGYVVADNMTVPDPGAGERYRQHIRAQSEIESVLLPIGWGLEVSRKLAAI